MKTINFPSDEENTRGKVYHINDEISFSRFVLFYISSRPTLYLNNVPKTVYNACIAHNIILPDTTSPPLPPMPPPPPPQKKWHNACAV